MKKISTKNPTLPTKTRRKRLLILSILLAVLLVATAFCVWYYYSNDQSKQASNHSTANQNNQTNPINQLPDNNHPELPKETILKIPELGIQFTLPEGLEDLEYRVIEGNGGSDVIRHVTFITKSLMDLDKQKSGNNGGYCTAERGVIGGIILYKNSHHDEGGYANTTKVKSGHAGYMGTQSGCSVSEEVFNLQLQQASLLREASKTITTIE